MILNALCEYYDILANDEETGICKYGYKRTNFSYKIVITEEGELFSIIPLVIDKKDKPKSAIMPKNMKKTGIASSPVCDNMTYLLGVTFNKKDGKKERTIDRVKFQAAKSLHSKLFQEGKSREAVAIVKFFDKWEKNIDNAWDNEHILASASESGDEPFSGNGVFSLVGETKCFHECDEIISLWLAENKRPIDKKKCPQNIPKKKITLESGICSILGENLEISRLHTMLKGVHKDNLALISFNVESFESYGILQSYNSRVSEEAMFKYTTALQYLLDNKDYKLNLGDDTTVFWASSPKKEYMELVLGLINGVVEDDFEDDDQETENNANQRSEKSKKNENKKHNDLTHVFDKKIINMVKSILESGSKGIYTQNPQFDTNVKFYILGMTPYTGRISVRYFYQNTLSQFCENIYKYHQETQIYTRGKFAKDYIRAKSLLFSTVSKKSSVKKVNPLLGGAIMRAIITGQKYPQILINQIIMRIKSDLYIDQVRASVIKACLIRNYKINKNIKEIGMAHNENSKNLAYNLGSVFAWLEKIQLDANYTKPEESVKNSKKSENDSKLNSTIKDKYFATACSNPVLVFPTLLKLANHHLAKIEGNYQKIELDKCMARIEGEVFPKTQSIEQQGSFILGYYQQIQKIYTKKEKIKDGEENN